MPPYLPLDSEPGLSKQIPVKRLGFKKVVYVKVIHADR